jgi:hypothetical protein
MTLSALGIFSAAGAGGVAPAISYDLLETQILGSSQSAVVFSSLGAYSPTYRHLQLRVVYTDSSSASNLRFNGDSGSNYSIHQLFADGSSTGSGGASSQTSLFLPITTNSSTQFGAYTTDILDFSSTTKNKTVKSFGGFATSGGYVLMRTGAYLSTTAVTSISIIGVGGLLTGSRFSLYGIKG